MTWHTRPAGLALAALLLAGCGGAPADPTSSLVVAWSQGEHRDLVGGDPSVGARRTTLIQTTADRARFVAGLPASIPTQERDVVSAVDLATHVIVVGVYANCAARSHITREDEVVRFVVDRDLDTRCAWAPIEVEVWSVARDGMPEQILLRDERGDLAAEG